MSFLDEVIVDGAGEKLYANFRAIGNIAVYDVDAMIERANGNAKDWQRFPLDHVQADQAAGGSINLTAIDVYSYGRGLSIQPGDPLSLVAPFGQQAVNAAAGALTFRWEVDTGLLGTHNYTCTSCSSAHCPPATAVAR